jgi:hypothetical protein
LQKKTKRIKNKSQTYTLIPLVSSPSQRSAAFFGNPPVRRSGPTEAQKPKRTLKALVLYCYFGPMLPTGILNFRVSTLRFVQEYVWARNTVWREGAVHDSTSTKRGCFRSHSKLVSHSHKHTIAKLDGAWTITNDCQDSGDDGSVGPVISASVRGQGQSTYTPPAPSNLALPLSRLDYSRLLIPLQISFSISNSILHYLQCKIIFCTTFYTVN